MADQCAVPDGYKTHTTPGWVTVERVQEEGEEKPQWGKIKHWNYFCDRKDSKEIFSKVKDNFFGGKLGGVDSVATPRKPEGDEVPVQFRIWNCSDEAELLKIGQNLVDTLKLAGSITSPYMYLRQREKNEVKTHLDLRIRLLQGRIPRKAFMVRKRKLDEK